MDKTNFLSTRPYHLRIGDTSNSTCPNCGKICPTVSMAPSDEDLHTLYVHCDQYVAMLAGAPLTLGDKGTDLVATDSEATDGSSNPPLQALINKAVEKYLTDSFGPRCNTRDIEDISAEDLGDSRCIVCQQWEYYDEWVDTQGERLKELRDKA